MSTATWLLLLGACSVCAAVATWAATRWRAEVRMDDALDADMAEIVATADEPPADLMAATLDDLEALYKKAQFYDQDAEPSYCCFACPSTDTTLTAFGIPTCADHASELVP